MLTSLRKRILTLGASLAIALVPAIAPVAVYAATDTAPNIQNNVACGSTLDVQQTAGTDCTNQLGDGTTQIQDIVKKIINIFSIVVGVVAVIMIIVGGFKYITSGGDSGNISSAKNTIIYALIGLVIVALSQFIVQFVLDKAVNTN